MYVNTDRSYVSDGNMVKVTFKFMSLIDRPLYYIIIVHSAINSYNITDFIKLDLITKRQESIIGLHDVMVLFDALMSDFDGLGYYLGCFDPCVAHSPNYYFSKIIQIDK